jgi:hypothetical protein
MLAALCLPLANASNTCMVTMVSGAADADGISVTFRNAGKLPIRRLEFNCAPIRPQARKVKGTLCHAENGLFFPGTEYIVSYPYPIHLPRSLTVSLRSAILSDGYIWKPDEEA